MTFEEDGHLVTERKSVDGEAIQIETEATIPEDTSIDVTVYQGTSEEELDSVSRDADNTSFAFSNRVGVFIETHEEVTGLTATLSSNTSGVTTAGLYHDGVHLLESVPISNGEATFTATLEANQRYSIEVGADGAEYTVGQSDSVDYPYSGDHIDIVGGGGFTSLEEDNAYNIVTVETTADPVTTDNSQEISIDDGTNTYLLDQFASVQGSDYWLRVDLATTDTAVSPQFDAATVTVEQPPLPDDISLSSSDTEIDVTITDNATNEDGRRVEYRQSDESSWTQDADLAANETSHTITGLLNGEEYEVRTEVYNNDGGEYSNVESEITSLPNPTNLSASNVTGTAADLSWSASHNYGDTRVEYRESDSSSWTTDGTISRTTTSHTLSGLKHGEQYDARVVAQTEHTEAVDQ